MHRLLGETHGRFSFPSRHFWSDYLPIEKVAYRIARTRTAFGRLKDNVWERKGLVLASSSKSTETSSNSTIPTLYLWDLDSLQLTYQAAQRLPYGMSQDLAPCYLTWRDRVPDTEVIESIRAILMRSQVRWIGHVHHMDDCHLPKRLLYSELSTGKRSLGRPKPRYRDTLKVSLK